MVRSEHTCTGVHAMHARFNLLHYNTMALNAYGFMRMRIVPLYYVSDRLPSCTRAVRTDDGSVSHPRPDQLRPSLRTWQWPRKALNLTLITLECDTGSIGRNAGLVHLDCTGPAMEHASTTSTWCPCWYLLCSTGVQYYLMHGIVNYSLGFRSGARRQSHTGGAPGRWLNEPCSTRPAPAIPVDVATVTIILKSKANHIGMRDTDSWENFRASL